MRVRFGTFRRILTGILAALAAAALAMWFIVSVNNLGGGRAEVGRQQLETALRRAAVACYASEGVYPPTLEYLTEHYGVQINMDQYIVFYEIFADNLMPDITVLEKGSG